MQTFRDTEDEEIFFQHSQLSKYVHIYSITLQIAIPQVAGRITLLEPIMQIMEDADFHITHLSGSVTSPTDLNGKRRIDASSDMNIGFAMAGSPNRSDRGVSFKLFDPALNLRLTEGRVTNNAVDLAAQAAYAWMHSYVNFQDVFTPGYGTEFGKPVPFKYYIPRSQRLKVQLQCFDLNTGNNLGDILYQRVSMAFIGNRYAT